VSTYRSVTDATQHETYTLKLCFNVRAVSVPVRQNAIMKLLDSITYLSGVYSTVLYMLLKMAHTYMLLNMTHTYSNDVLIQGPVIPTGWVVLGRLSKTKASLRYTTSKRWAITQNFWRLLHSLRLWRPALKVSTIPKHMVGLTTHCQSRILVLALIIVFCAMCPCHLYIISRSLRTKFIPRPRGGPIGTWCMPLRPISIGGGRAHPEP
jgi:hypothetical protein